LPDILEEHSKSFKDFGPYLNLVHGPIWYNLNQLPENVKGQVVTRLESISKEVVDSYMYSYHIPGIINYIKQGVPAGKNWAKFIEYTKLHDQYRGQDFATVYPEYAKIIGL
jgi:hypothetical protein